MTASLAAQPPRRPSPAEAPAEERLLASGPVVLALLTVLAAVLAGLAFTAPSPPAEGSADVGFARDMSQHHGQAVAMAEAIRNRTQDSELRVLTADIGLTQQGQIGMMNGWLALWGRTSTASGPRMAWMGTPTGGLMPGMATSSDVLALSKLPLPQAEARFLQLMVAHHAGGVTMAQAGQELASEPQVRLLASGIAAAQTAEIDFLQSLLAARGLPPAPVATADMAVALPEGGHQAAAGLTVRDVVLLSVLTLGLLALSWLIVDTVARRLGVRARPPGPVALVLVAAATVAAGVHIVLAPQHAQESAAYGLFFVLTALALAVAGAAVLAGLVRVGAVTAAVTSAVLLASYVLLRLVPPPGAVAVQGVDGWGVLAVTVELVVLACAAAVLRRRGADRPQPV